ncbi:hypothetical protein AOXY_G30508 [Acipenser oxyrinchus oxyrinchus]|uniref:Beta/gamma crystallin 'Greek key' domain-containing protein n=1 Tax=Acipenser oxyrinchus oxyrinchus TaxID=40147 RepID=A0AAD8CM53_ACIOX|nr:hypothetical protein AOXY_G30508 [Acipenser oxyrinchus oxyrinchus]
MAKKEKSQKNSFYKMFAKSEVNLEDCDKKDKGSARSFKSLFKNDRVKKKQMDENVEERSKDSTDGTVEDVGDAGDPAHRYILGRDGENWPDLIGSKQTSIYSTAPSSKKRGLSYSELDLRKGSLLKRFSSFVTGSSGRKKRSSILDVYSSSANLRPDERAALDDLDSSITSANQDPGIGTSIECLDTLSPGGNTQGRHGRFVTSSEFLPQDKGTSLVPLHNPDSGHSQRPTSTVRTADPKAEPAEPLEAWAEDILTTYLGPPNCASEENLEVQPEITKDSLKERKKLFSSPSYNKETTFLSEVVKRDRDLDLAPNVRTALSRVSDTSSHGRKTKYNITITMTKEDHEGVSQDGPGKPGTREFVSDQREHSNKERGPIPEKLMEKAANKDKHTKVGIRQQEPLASASRDQERDNIAGGLDSISQPVNRGDGGATVKNSSISPGLGNITQATNNPVEVAQQANQSSIDSMQRDLQKRELDGRKLIHVPEQREAISQHESKSRHFEEIISRAGCNHFGHLSSSGQEIDNSPGGTKLEKPPDLNPRNELEYGEKMEELEGFNWLMDAEGSGNSHNYKEQPKSSDLELESGLGGYEKDKREAGLNGTLQTMRELTTDREDSGTDHGNKAHGIIQDSEPGNEIGHEGGLIGSDRDKQGFAVYQTEAERENTEELKAQEKTCGGEVLIGFGQAWSLCTEEHRRLRREKEGVCESEQADLGDDKRRLQFLTKPEEPVSLAPEGEESQTSPPIDGCGAETREEREAHSKAVSAAAANLRLPELAPPSQPHNNELLDRKVWIQPGDSGAASSGISREDQLVLTGEEPAATNSFNISGAPGQSVAEDFLFESPWDLDQMKEMSANGSFSYTGIGVLSTTMNLKPDPLKEPKDDRRKRFHKVSLVNDKSNPSEGHSPFAEKTHNDGIKSPREIVEYPFMENLSPREIVEYPFMGNLKQLPERLEKPPADTIPETKSLVNNNLVTQSASTLEDYNKKSTLILKTSPASHTTQPDQETVIIELKKKENTDSTITATAANSKGQQNYSESREEPAKTTNHTWDSQAVSAPVPEADSEANDIYRAVRVEFIPSSEPEEGDTSTAMDNLVDTLRGMELPHNLRLNRGPRSARPVSLPSFSSLPAIDENLPSPDVTPIPSSRSIEFQPHSPVPPAPGQPPKLQPDFGFRWSPTKDMLSPLEMMKKQLEQDSVDKPKLPSLLQRSSSETSNVYKNTQLSGSTLSDSLLSDRLDSKLTPTEDKLYSRLNNSLLFSSIKAQEARDKPVENGKAISRPDSFFRRSSMPDLPSSVERSLSQVDGPKTSSYERFSYLTSSADPLSGGYDPRRISLLPPSPLEFKQQSSFDVHSIATPAIETQRNNVLPKYTAFPDAYRTKEKEHGKINPRPGKMLVYQGPGFTGEEIVIQGDVIDATPWDLPEPLCIRVLRGGWVLYEKPSYKGEKCALDEGDHELYYPFGQSEEQPPEDQDPETKPSKRFIIGSLRRVVRDYSVPAISLFPEENAEGKKVTFRDTSEDSRIYGLPIKAKSIIINAGLWLVFSKPFFEGVPRVLEVGGYTNVQAWGATEPDVASVHPLKIGEPKVEKPDEPKVIIFEKSYFQGKSREIHTDSRDFLTRVDSQNVFMSSAGSLKVVGGCWVGYEKEGFRGHQYLLEEGEFHDWRVWGGCNSELRSLHVIRADFTEPEMIMYECTEEGQEGHSLDVLEAIPDLELVEYGIMTQSIRVLNGAWIAYSNVDYSGSQYILEKGFYNSYQDWGGSDSQIASVQPVRLAVGRSPNFKNKIQLFSELEFRGSCLLYEDDHTAIPEEFQPQSCRVMGGSWVVYEGREYSGNLYVLGQGEYPNFATMGCPPKIIIRSVKMVPLVFTEPSISLYSLECFEGKENRLDSEVQSLLSEGFNNHVLSVRVSGGVWVVCEHSNYRGRQILLETIEITNWLKFSEFNKIGSLYPVRQNRVFFHLKHRESGHYMATQAGLEDMKSGRVVVTEQLEGMSHVWYYQDGLIKNKLAPELSLQVMGKPDNAAKVVLWHETRQPRQSWRVQPDGHILSQAFEGMTLDVKGGKTYDRDHVVVWTVSEERPSQHWDMESL